MLVNCLGLSDCETLLAESVNHVQLLGEIPLTDQDIDQLAVMVRDIITPNISKGTRILKTKYPVSFACFLVGMGRFYDKEIGFWPILEKKVGEIDVSWKTKWGKFFLQFLEMYGLPQFDEEEGLAYVTPILSHACIPGSCLDEYFGRVLVPLVNRDLINPLDSEELIHDLKTRRAINNLRLELEQKRKGQKDILDGLHNTNEQLKERIALSDTVFSLIMREEECKKRSYALQGLENSEYIRQNLVDQINGTTEKIQRLEKNEMRIWEEIDSFREKHQPILDRQAQIDELIRIQQVLAKRISEAKFQEEALFSLVTTRWTALSIHPWEHRFGTALIDLMIDKLHTKIEQVQILEEQQKKIRGRLEVLRDSERTAKRPRPIFLTPFILLWRLFFRSGAKAKISSSDEPQKLRAACDLTQANIQQARVAVKEEFWQLPINSQRLEEPKINLYHEIVEIRETCIQEVELSETRRQLEQEAEGLIERSRELVCSLGIADEGENGPWIDRLTAALVDAVKGQEHARKIRQILEEKIRPAFEAANTEHQRLRWELELLDQRLANIGGGSVDEGLSQIREFLQFREITAQARLNLIEHYENLASLEDELKNVDQVNFQSRLEAAATQNRDKISEIEDELKSLDQDLSRYPTQYFGIDEPIRRFLLYGGTASERILRSSVSLLVRTRAGESIGDISEPGLSERLIQRFMQWWEYHEAKAGERSNSNEETNPATGERFRAPLIAFDLTAGEMIATLPIQRILRPERGTSVTMNVFGDNLNSPIYSVQLNFYGRSKGLVETKLCEHIPLTEPAEKFIFRLTHKDQPIHEWEIPGVSAALPFLAFADGGNRRIKGEGLPKSYVILVIQECHAIHPENCVITSGEHLYGDWSEYVWYELDLTTCEDFCLVGEDGRSVSISLTSDHGIHIILVGGEHSPNIVSNEYPVYLSPPEYIRISNLTKNDLHLFRFSILCEDEKRLQFSKHYQLNEVASIFKINDGGWLEIPLKQEQFLGSSPFGLYTLRIYQPPYLDWHTTFCVVPGIGLSFNQKVYPPYREQIPNVQALLTIPEVGSFHPDHPAILVSNKGNSSLLHVPMTEDRITGILTSSHNRKGVITLSLSLIIPKIRWRLQGLEEANFNQWQDSVEEELWIGDWLKAQELFLLVEMPSILNGEVSLEFPGKSVIIPCSNMLEHKVRFDMKALEDMLRNGPSLETVGIYLRSDEISIPNIPLFTIRTRWLAEITKCFFQPEGDTARVDVSWKEWGEANQKTARLWYLSGNQPKLIQEQIVPPSIQETVFRSPVHEVKSGMYLIHLEPYDPWSSRAACPNLNDPNTTIIEIVTTTPEKVVIVKAVIVDPKHSYFLLHNAYRIHIIGKVINQKLPDNTDMNDIGHVLITPLNENWYVGSLEVNGIPRLIDHLSDTNPVKFEYDSEKKIVTSIEDRHGDGAVYCFDCRMLFWHQGTVDEEKRKKHRNYGPIEGFKVDWETE